MREFNQMSIRTSFLVFLLSLAVSTLDRVWRQVQLVLILPQPMVAGFPTGRRSQRFGLPASCLGFARYGLVATPGLTTGGL